MGRVKGKGVPGRMAVTHLPGSAYNPWGQPVFCLNFADKRGAGFDTMLPPGGSSWHETFAS
jgi:hypothetical protein